MECASKSGGISPSFALRVRIRFVALIIQASSFWKRLLTLPEIPPSTASNELLSCRHQIMLNTDKAQRSNKVRTQQKPILNKWGLNDRPFVRWWFNLGNKQTTLLALCSRNFQNVRLSLHGVRIFQSYCHSNFMWNQILINWNDQKCDFWQF